MAFHRLLLCACLAWGHRIQRLGDLNPDASEEALLKEAKLAFKPSKFYIPRSFSLVKMFFKVVNIQLNSTESIFEQSREALEYKDPGAWGANWTASIGFQVNFTDQKGVDREGLRKEWLSLVVKSVVAPESHTQKNLQCIISGKCADAGAPQYLLKAMPTGELIPIHLEEMESSESSESSESESSGMLGSVLKSAYNAYEYAYESVMGDAMPLATGKRFKFLGKWLARAHLVSGLGYSPMSFHEIIYRSLVHGTLTWNQPESIYGEDAIDACEWVVSIFRSRRPQEMQSYGWVQCSEVKDPETNKYLEASCYKPIYKDPMMWDALYMSWGPFAPKGAKADDSVPFEAAKDFTEKRCQATWKSFAQPVMQMVKGFREVIPADSGFWPLLNEDWTKLKHLLEGNSDVDVDALLKKVQWEGWQDWSDEEKAVVTEVLHDLQTEGQGLPATERLLNQLLRFFTGSFKEPVEGWENTKVEFNRLYSEKCLPLIGKTCFNELRISSACLKDAETFKQIISESVLSTGFGYD